MIEKILRHLLEIKHVEDVRVEENKLSFSCMMNYTLAVVYFFVMLFKGEQTMFSYIWRFFRWFILL